MPPSGRIPALEREVDATLRRAAAKLPPAAVAAPVTGVPDIEVDFMRVALRDRQASYREFRPRFVSGLIVALLLAGFTALAAWLR